MFSEIIIDDEMNIKEGPQYLLFFLQLHLFAIKAEQIVEIVELPQITKVPLMQECVRGICNIRGSVVSVIDPAKCLMDRDFMHSVKSSLVIVYVEHNELQQKIGLIVDEVCEIEVFERNELQEVPEYGLPMDFRYIESMVTYQDDFIPILSLQKVLDIDSLSKRVDDES